MVCFTPLICDVYKGFGVGPYKEKRRESVRLGDRESTRERERRKVFGFVWSSHNHVTHTLTIVLVGCNYGYFNPS